MSRSYIYTGFGNEVDEAAAWDYIRDGYLLGPRTVLKGRTKHPQFELPKISADVGELPSMVQETLIAAMGKVKGARRAVMFSGGFDSTLMAYLARHAGAQVTALTVRFDDFNPVTVAGAIEYAKKAGIDHQILHVNAVEFLSAFEAISGITDEPILDFDVAIVHAALKKYDTGIAGDVIISGMGSDEWFGNGALDTRKSIAEHLDWAMVDCDAHQRVAETQGCSFIFPFLSVPMLALSGCIPPAMKKDKKLLRALAVAAAIPNQGTRAEIQVPPLIENTIIRKYGDRAWPAPVSMKSRNTCKDEHLYRQIILGLWLEKAKSRMAEV